jgi:hypothetical protein
MKKMLIFIFTILISTISYSIEIISYGVDGSSNNVNVVIKDRNLVAFFEYKEGCVVLNYEIKITTIQSGLNSETTIWYVQKTTSTENTINCITRTEIPRDILEEDTTYFILLSVYDTDGGSKTVKDKFYTTKSAASLNLEFSLSVDYNNPFCPSNCEKTKIRYLVKNKDYPVKIYIFTISGKFVRKLTDSVAMKDVVYTIDWDGKDENGNIVPQGIYVVTMLVPDNPPITKLLGVVEKF